MSLVNQIENDITAAMKGGDIARTAALRLLKNSLKNEQIKLGRELAEEDAIKVLAREAKQRQESISSYEQAGRTELAQTEKEELDIIRTYLPAQLSEEEIAKLVDEAIAEAGVKDASQIGAAISSVMQKAAGSADGATVARIVRQRLS
ncbi:MAG TPA: GatB/YqeY domain-containing protein [Candidatus Dormibacteraeota bacterium]|nr:GatB/YqeY domain-containing protein [Candidatus Dormibacteraeota bacterium]